jgi:dienelactone hydrolase
MPKTLARSTRPLMNFHGTPGFICDWHIAGFFDSGLQHNPEPNLFDKKKSTKWKDDHLERWGGCKGIQDVPASGPKINFALFPLNWTATMLLRYAREEFPDWEKRLEGIDTDRWNKLYYALGLVQSPQEMDAELIFSGWDGCRLWINGKLSFEEHSYHHVIMDMEKVSFKLREGLNSFLFQLDRDGVTARIATPSDPGAVEKLRSVAVGDAPAGREISTFAQMRRHLMELSVRMPFNGKTPDELARWQKNFGAHFHSCLGDGPPKNGSQVDRVEETRGEGYVRTRYNIACEGDGIMPAYVLVPEKHNGRTIVIAHGHENFRVVAGAEKPIGPKIFKGPSLKNYGEQLAQHGFIVAVANERAFAERRDHFGSEDPCNTAAWRAMAIGYTLPRLHIADLHRLYDFVCSLPDVDPKRTGLGGISGGGTLTYLTGAFDERFKAVCVMCGMCRYTDYAVGINACGMQVVPRLYPTGDVGEVLSLIAPRPLFLGQGRLDSTFDVAQFKSIAEDARKAYRAAGAEDRLQPEIFELAHQFNVELAAKFFTKWL